MRARGGIAQLAAIHDALGRHFDIQRHRFDGHYAAAVVIGPERLLLAVDERVRCRNLAALQRHVLEHIGCVTDGIVVCGQVSCPNIYAWAIGAPVAGVAAETA